MTIATPACENVNLSLDNTSTGGVNFFWDFGNGSVPGFEPNFSYSTSGNYNVQMIAQTASGCTDTTSASVQVLDSPNAAFSTNTLLGCAPLDVSFTNNSTGR